MKLPIAVMPLLLLLASPLSQAAERYITVQGEAQQQVEPDRVVVPVTFSAEGDNVVALQKQVEQQARRFLAGLQRLGIADKAINGSAFQIFPRYVKGQQQGSRVQQQYEVHIQGFARYPKVLSLATASGASNIGRASLRYSNEQALYQKVLALALGNARQKAQSLAAAGNVKLGHLLDVEEQGSYQPPVLMMQAKAMQSSAPVQRPGEIKVSATIKARFAIDD